MRITTNNNGPPSRTDLQDYPAGQAKKVDHDSISIAQGNLHPKKVLYTKIKDGMVFAGSTVVDKIKKIASIIIFVIIFPVRCTIHLAKFIWRTLVATPAKVQAGAEKVVEAGEWVAEHPQVSASIAAASVFGGAALGPFGAAAIACGTGAIVAAKEGHTKVAIGLAVPPVAFFAGHNIGPLSRLAGRATGVGVGIFAKHPGVAAAALGGGAIVAAKTGHPKLAVTLATPPVAYFAYKNRETLTRLMRQAANGSGGIVVRHPISAAVTVGAVGVGVAANQVAKRFENSYGKYYEKILPKNLVRIILLAVTILGYLSMFGVAKRVISSLIQKKWMALNPRCLLT